MIPVAIIAALASSALSKAMEKPPATSGGGNTSLGVTTPMNVVGPQEPVEDKLTKIQQQYNPIEPIAISDINSKDNIRSSYDQVKMLINKAKGGK